MRGDYTAALVPARRGGGPRHRFAIIHRRFARIPPFHAPRRRAQSGRGALEARDGAANRLRRRGQRAGGGGRIDVAAARRGSPAMPQTPRPAPLPPGWRGIVRLALDALIAGCIASVVLLLAAFTVATQAHAASAAAVHASLALGDAGNPPLDAPLVATEVDVAVAGIVARTKVTQHFINPTGQWREGLYTFPLPDRAAVDRLHMQVGERIVEGEIREKEDARATYAKAKAAGIKASLVESARPNLFSARVAHLGPGETVSITIEYQETLRYDQGSFYLRVPLAITPRYSPGASPDAADGGAGFRAVALGDLDDDEAVPTPPYVAPGAPPVNPVKLHVSVDAGFALASITSTSHAIDVKEDVAHRYDVALADDIVPADRDLELAWKPDVGAAPGAALFTEVLDGKTYALLMMMPPSESSPATIAPREATFIVDTSGSMSGASMEQAREAVLFALARLKPGDRFNVIEFNSVTRPLFTAPMPVDAATVASAQRFVRGLKADGGTEMKPALEAAFAAPPAGGFVQQVVFLTDGAVDNERDLLALIAARAGDRRLFTVGIGAGPNTWFLRKAAEAGRGTATFIGDIHDVKERMTALYAKLENPALTGIEAAWSAAADAYPRKLPDLYDGEPIVMTAAFDTPLVTLSLTAKRGERAYGALLPLASAQPAQGIATLWARDRIEALSDAVVGGDAAAIKPLIVKTALDHHLVSRYTSLVAVDVTPTLPAGESSIPSPMPLDLPAGYEDATLGALPQTATPAPLLAALAAVLAAAALATLALASRRRVATLAARVHAARQVC
jgi:Ca-activated chloride channel family protein